MNTTSLSFDHAEAYFWEASLCIETVSFPVSFPWTRQGKGVVFQVTMEKGVKRNEAIQLDWDRIIETYNPLHIRYPDGELIYQAETYAAGAYLIGVGLVSDRCSSRNDGSQNPPAELLGPGDLIGLEILLEGHNELHLSCARTVTETELFFFERELFLSMLEEEDEISRSCMSYLSHRFYSLKRWVSSFFNSTTEERLCRLLLNLAERFGERNDEGMILLPTEIKRATFPELLGRSRSEVSRAISSLPNISVIDERITISLENLRQWLVTTEASERN